ncbi:MAG: FKBP-type peptidyl-prolyl cis-trans isomerase [Caldilineaceae bacterium]|nr:FKBP-type peptidyl-prolyl cis-trans isomerase [Caldilineaceae bacterium]
MSNATADNTTLRVKDNMVVSLAYTLTVENEQAAQQTRKPSSKSFLQGRHQVVRGLEKALYGMSVGDEKNVVVKSPNEYGESDPAAIKTLSRQSAPTFANATPGQKLRLMHKKSGKVERAVVVDVQPETIVLDFNHPLAGKTLHYHVRVDDLRQATPEEIETGEVIETGEAVGTGEVKESASEQAAG